MSYVNELLKELTSRLPELEWKIGELGAILQNQNIPSGLFHSGPELTGASCIEEIRRDIRALSLQNNERSAHYLANRIKHKINVLVSLCQMQGKKIKVEDKICFGIKMLSTRQQWITSLEQDISTLEKQQHALQKTLANMIHGSNTEAILALQKELGEAERRLTLAKETLNQALC